MLCDRCQKNEAKIYYTEIINGKKTEQHLCEECAAKHSTFQALNSLGKEEMNLSGMLFGLLGNIQSTNEKEETPIAACKNCKMTYEEFTKVGQFGCEECYKSFGRVLNKNLRSIHGADTHTGKQPKGYISEAKRLVNELPEIDKLTIQLQQAIEQEEYEEAAKFRDKIRALKKGANKDNEKMV
ncbi:MAG: UvrB/UvrC motif-containing protein [Clostridiales bacterium]|nr:UvrB/UvrC motif-containing protein [Clostridiales bacterium]